MHTWSGMHKWLQSTCVSWVVQFSEANPEERLTILGFLLFFHRAGLSWKPRAGVLIARSQQVNLHFSGAQPQVTDCPSQQSSMPVLQGGIKRMVSSVNCCMKALDFDSYTLAVVCSCLKEDLSVWEVANVMLFWNCWSWYFGFEGAWNFNSAMQAPSYSASSNVSS